MKRGAKGPARSARQGQNTAASNVMLTPTLTQTVVKINQAQSLYIVQTTVSAAFSTILWIYNLFPDDYFESRSYSLDDPTFPYSVKTPAQAVWEGKQGNDKAIVTWDFLLNGKTAQTDKIWLWLDGVHDALKRKYLASLQISFHNGDVSRDTVIAAYVMKFNYSETSDKIQFDISSGNQTVEVTAEDMQDLKNVFNRLVKMSRKTDQFPEDPTISLQLTYNETCPAEYEPRGFVAAPDPSIILNQDGFNIGNIDTTYHCVGMSLIAGAAGYGSNGSFRAARSNSQAFNQDSFTPIQATASPCEGSSSIMNTQEHADRQLIREMVPLGREVGDTQRFQDTQSQRTVEEGSSPFILVEKNSPPPEDRRFYFDPQALQDLHPTHKWRNKQVQISYAYAADIECHCGKKFSGMTVQCEICQKRQHLQCYGYLETDVFDIHMCYGCLLISEPNLSKNMQQLCLLRQLAWVVSMEGYPLKESDLAKHIGCTVKDITTMSQRLAQEKYLRKISRPQSKKHKDYHRRSQIPSFQFMEGERERLFKQYLNPTFKIEKYLYEHQQTSADKQQPSQPSQPLQLSSSPPVYSRMSSMRPESVKLVPTSHLPKTPQPPRAVLDSNDFVYGLFDDDDQTTTPYSRAAAASNIDCSTQGEPSNKGSPGPRSSLGLKRKADALEKGAGRLKRPSYVRSPFVPERRLRG